VVNPQAALLKVWEVDFLVTVALAHAVYP